MQIEAGKYYRDEAGNKRGPMKHALADKNRWWVVGEGSDMDDEWATDGTALLDHGSLIAEWSEGPVRTETVTKRRIVPGVYGRLEVTMGATPDRVRVGLTSNADNKAHWVTTLTATELDSLAMVASQLAEALRDVD